MLQFPVNKLLVTIEKKYQDKLGVLKIDTSFAPEEYAMLKGIVRSVPLRVDRNQYRGNIQELAVVGDEVWFSYGIVFDYTKYENGETPSYKNLITYNGEEYWQVDYGEVFCIKRGDEILMPAQYVLLEPISNEQGDVRPSGFVLEKKSDLYEDRAKVVAVPLMNVSCSVGDIIPIEIHYVQKYKIFDKQHYIIPVRRLIAKF